MRTLIAALVLSLAVPAFAGDPPKTDDKAAAKDTKKTDSKTDTKKTDTKKTDSKTDTKKTDSKDAKAGDAKK